MSPFFDSLGGAGGFSGSSGASSSTNSSQDAAVRTGGLRVNASGVNSNMGLLIIAGVILAVVLLRGRK